MKIDINLDELKYLKEKHKKANEKLKEYYNIEKLREDIDYLMKDEQ